MKNKAFIPNPALEPLHVLVGKWKTIGTHPYILGTKLHGFADCEWIEGGSFIKMTTTIDHPEFPDGIALIGSDNKNSKFYMIYFDERTLSRKYDLSIKGSQIKWWRDNLELSQKFTLTIEASGKKMSGKGEMCRDGTKWEKDLDLEYTRV
jgi:hypothetical protein